VRVQCSDGRFYEGRVQGWNSKIAEYDILLDDGDRLNSPIDANSWDVQVLSLNNASAAQREQADPSSEDAAQERGEAWVGLSLMKTFRGYGRFKGTIARYNAENKTYAIEYEDGDAEVLHEHQVYRLLYPARGKHKSSS
jgi:hypothetical protein